MGIRSDLFTVYLYNINLADSGAEKHVRKIIDNGKFTFENEEYVVIQNSKPSHETKTDFYILAKKSIVPELVQSKFTVNELVNKLNFILDNKNKITNDYNDTIKQLGDGGCFDKISQEILSSFDS